MEHGSIPLHIKILIQVFFLDLLKILYTNCSKNLIVAIILEQREYTLFYLLIEMHRKYTSQCRMKLGMPKCQRNQSLLIHFESAQMIEQKGSKIVNQRR
jgi:hypothetical protein